MAGRPPPDARYGLGLDADSNRLTPHNDLWAEAYEHEAALIVSVLGDRCIAIEHIGSTAVTGLAAKPIIDIQIGVADLADVADFIEPMARVGYDHAHNHGIPEHEVFGRGQPRTFLVHVVVHESEQWWRPLRFRDRLRASDELRAQYARVKQTLAETTNVRAEYTSGKTAFVDEHSR